MSNPEIDTGTNLDFLAQLLSQSQSSHKLMQKSLSPYRLELRELLFLKRFEAGQLTIHQLTSGSARTEEELQPLLEELTSQGYLESAEGSSRAYSLSALGRRALDSKWDEVERLRVYMSERMSPLTLEAVVGLLKELNAGYFQGLD